MAHPGEAQGVIETFKIKKVSQDLFQNEELVLLLTGEGPFEAAIKTALTISKYPFKEILNLGIAGSLSDTFRPGDFVPVRTIYLVQDFRPQFKTFQSLENGADCLTSFERILDHEKAKGLRGIGKIVDREAWGVAMAAKTAGIPFKSYKLISDEAGTLGACELVKEKAREFSDQMALELKKILKSELHEDEGLEIKGLHFTFTTKHRFETLLQKIMIKEEKTRDEILSLLEVGVIAKLEVSPKERAKRLLDRMDDMVDPMKKILQKKKEVLEREFQEKGLKISIDPIWENPKATISFEAATDDELKKTSEILKNVSLKSFTDVMNGDV